MSFFFVNGLYRSGTSLLQKLLLAHPSLSVPWQPTLDALIETKKHFYHTIGHPETYAFLGPCFNETRYLPDDFLAYLESVDFISAYRGRLRESATRPEASWLGTREMMADEYLPCLLRHGFKVILIVRDVRDVIASANVTRREAFMGKSLPTLFTIRNWRKTVAFALVLQDHPDFFLVRYEDLVRQPQQWLDAICRFLGVDDFDPAWLHSGIRDEQGNLWQGNSSFEAKANVDQASVGSFRGVLSEATQRYIEACAGPEMQRMGYLAASLPDPETVIGNFVEPFAMERDTFPADYTHSVENRELELRRLALLRKGQATEEEQRRYFIFPRAYQELAAG